MFEKSLQPIAWRALLRGMPLCQRTPLFQPSFHPSKPYSIRQQPHLRPERPIFRIVKSYTGGTFLLSPSWFPYPSLNWKREPCVFNIRLRTKFLLSLLAISAGLTVATLLIVSYSVQKRLRESIREELRGSPITYQ